MKIKSGTYSPRKRWLYRILLALCLVAVLIFIFANSIDDGDTSGGKSVVVTEWINNLSAKVGSDFRVTEYQVRKTAHFSEYALLGFLLTSNLCMYTKKLAPYLAWPLFFGLLTAVSDEFLQSFVPGRTGQVSDILIDFSGICTGILIVYLLASLRPSSKTNLPTDKEHFA